MPSKNSAQPVARTYRDTKLRRDNREQNIAEYRAGKLRLDSRPLALFVELTQNCNLECPMCQFGAKYDPMWNTLMSAHAIITVSCDAADPELFAKLRKGGTVGHLRETVRIIVDARDRNQAPRENVTFNTVVSRDSLTDLPAIVDLETALALTARRDPATTPAVPWM